MGDSFRIETPSNYRRWSLGARSIAGGFKKTAGAPWAFANEWFFDETQAAVHVISGDLKATGRHSTELEGVRVVSVVEYGGPVPGTNREVVYAQFEIDRGGEHDYMGRGWEASQPIFERVFGKTWLRMVGSWDRP